MTTVERARQIIATATNDNTAGAIIAALAEKRIGFVTIRASADLFTRYHAHLRFLGHETGYGYEQIKADAEKYAMRVDMWPSKLWVETVEVAGEEFKFDFQIPLTSTIATNAQLLKAYEFIVETAAEHKISLPENWEE